MIDLKVRAWNGLEFDYNIAIINGSAWKEEDAPDGDVISHNGMNFYSDWAHYKQKDWPIMQSTTFTAPCGREIWFGDIYYNAGYGNLHIKTMSDILLLIEGLAENDIGAYLGNEYENPELLS